MRRRFALLVVGIVLLLSAGRVTAQTDKPAADMVRGDLFGPDKVWALHLRLGAKEWQSMQPRGGGGFFGMLPPKKEGPREIDISPEDIHKSKLNGMEFAYVKGDLEFAGKEVKGVGVRFKGNSTYFVAAQGLRRPFKIDVNRYVDGQTIHGLTGLNLANNVHDPTRIRDALAYAVFRSAMVPVPRTAFIKLHLTVDGKHDKTYVGLYTLIEPLDKAFQRAHFKGDLGMLLKPERIQGLPYLGENWAAYQDRYNPKREPTDAQKKRLIEFTRLVNRAADAAFAKKIGDYLDVDEFLRFMAVNSLVANVDSFFGTGHNYFLYLNPRTDRFHFIPWDLDLSLGNFVFASAQDQMEWSISQPYLGKNRLAERILAIDEHNKTYRDNLRLMTEKVFTPKVMNVLIADLEKTVRDAKDRNFANPFAFPGAPKTDLRQFVAKRSESVLAQLDGKSEGRQLTMNFFFGGPGKGPPGKGPGFGKGK